MGYCPFFWFTWFCILFFPLIIVTRCAITLIAKTKRPTDWLLVAFYDLVLDKGLQEARETEKVFASGGQLYSYQDDVIPWLDATPDWENCAKQAKLRIKQAQELEAMRIERRKQRTALPRKIANVTGYVLKPIFVVLAMIAVYHIARGAYWLAIRITWHGFILASQVAGLVIAALSIGPLGAWAIETLKERMYSCPEDPGHVSLGMRIFSPIWTGLLGAVEFLFETVAAIYTRECPLIEWGDESGPIERNEAID